MITKIEYNKNSDNHNIPISREFGKIGDWVKIEFINDKELKLILLEKPLKEDYINEIQIEKNRLYKYWISNPGMVISHYYTLDECKKNYNKQLKELEQQFL